jgi:hypothetical protein
MTPRLETALAENSNRNMDSEISKTDGAQEAGRSSLHEVLCHVRMFKPQFAPLVAAGTKCQTVRPTPKRMPKAGDRISLRMWTGKPYRSKQRVLREATISEVAMVDITETGIAVNSYAAPCDDFAVADGFRNFFELRDWFKATHGLPFEGVVIKWHNERPR